MSGHARLSPSSSSRWLLCPASVSLWEHIPDRTNSAAELGTAVHEVGEVCLTTGSDADAFIGKHFNYIEVTQKMADDAQLYVDYVRSLMNESSELLVEQTINLNMIAPDTFGSSDAVVITDRTLHIVDYKNGRGYVHPEENTQLMLYALGAYYEHDIFYDFDNIALHIVQPNASTGSHCSVWELTPEKLKDFGVHAQEMALEALGDNPRCIAGAKQCEWCRGRSECKTLEEYSMKTLKGSYENLEDVDVYSNHVSLDDLANILANKKMITDLLKAYEERALFELESGNEIKGFKMVETRVNKSWVDANVAYDKLTDIFDVDDITTSKLLTPTQILKIAKKDEEKLSVVNGLWEVGEGRPTIAPNSDKRPPLSSKASAHEKLD